MVGHMMIMFRIQVVVFVYELLVFKLFRKLCSTTIVPSHRNKALPPTPSSHQHVPLPPIPKQLPAVPPHKKNTAMLNHHPPLPDPPPQSNPAAPALPKKPQKRNYEHNQLSSVKHHPLPPPPPVSVTVTVSM